jgi:hypothetical protein
LADYLILKTYFVKNLTTPKIITGKMRAFTQQKDLQMRNAVCSVLRKISEAALWPMYP